MLALFIHDLLMLKQIKLIIFSSVFDMFVLGNPYLLSAALSCVKFCELLRCYLEQSETHKNEHEHC